MSTRPSRNNSAGRCSVAPVSIPSWDGIFELQPTASSSYHGVTLALNRRLAHEVEWSAAYTWSHARDSASDFDEQPQNPYALADEWADSRYDERHRLAVSALFDLPIGEEEDRKPGEVPNAWVRAFSHIELAPILTVGSGHPVNVTTGGDDNRSGAFPFASRPLTVGRNSWRLPASATLDLRLLKYFNIKPHGKLDLVIEAFNVLNRTNVTQVNAVYGPLLAPLQSFGRPIEAGARQAAPVFHRFRVLEGGSECEVSNGCVAAVMFVACGMAAPVRAQTNVEQPLVDASGAPSSTMPAFRTPLFTPTVDFDQVIQQPAGPPPTPRHTGIKAMVKGLIIDFKYLPSRENLMWAGIGGGLALAVHPADDNVNEALVGSDFADNFFKAGEVLGELPTLLTSASVVYAVGRLKDKPECRTSGWT